MTPRLVLRFMCTSRDLGDYLLVQRALEAVPGCLQSWGTDAFPPEEGLREAHSKISRDERDRQDGRGICWGIALRPALTRAECEEMGLHLQGEEGEDGSGGGEGCENTENEALKGRSVKRGDEAQSDQRPQAEQDGAQQDGRGQEPPSSTSGAGKNGEAASNKRAGTAFAKLVSSAIIGRISFWRVDKRNFSGEIGYALHPGHWGGGVMREALGGTAAFAFERMGLNAIEANIDPSNTRSRRLLEAAGFDLEAHFKEHWYQSGRFFDSQIFRLLARKWKEKEQKQAK